MSLKAALEADQEIPESWSTYMSVVYGGRVPPLVGSYDSDKLEEAAREKLKSEPYSKGA